MPSTVDGTSLSYYGYSFEVPWRGIDREQNEGRWVEIDFKSGQIVRFVNPKYFQEDPVIARDDPVITNDGATKYEKYKAVLSMTPSQLSPFCSHQNFARALRLLEIKGMWFEHYRAVPDLYSFQTERYQGFEVSGLARNWQFIGLTLFDASDREFHISIYGERPVRIPGVQLTQFEINRVIQSFRAEP